MLNEFQILLEKFKALPPRRRQEPTFMEIAGFPHYENVISNILAFYLDPGESHGFGTLLIEAVLKATSKSTDQFPVDKDAKVMREVRTNSGKRIDIVVVWSDTVIIIENKIYAELYNDLNDYATHASKVYPGRNVIKLVFSIHAILNIQLTNGFQNLILKDFLGEAEAILVADETLGLPKYRTYFLDLVKNINNLTQGQIMDQTSLQFFSENADTIDMLVKEHIAIQRDVLRRINSMKSQIQFDKTRTNQWIWEQYDLVHDFNFQDGITVALDTFFELNGIKIVLWLRKHNLANPDDFLKTLALFKNQGVAQFARNPENRIILRDKQELSYFTEDAKIIELLNGIIKQIVV